MDRNFRDTRSLWEPNGRREEKWAESSVASHFLAGIEPVVLSSLAEHCRALCAEWNTRNLLHLSLQFDGAEILLNPYPVDSKSSPGAAIRDKSGFEVNLVEKHRKFPLHYVVLAPISAVRRDSPPIDSILYESGHCVLLSIFRLVGDAELHGSITDAAGSSPASVRKVRTYMQRITLLGEGSL